VIQYFGQSSLSIPFPHGNSLSLDRNYVRTCPSVLQQVKTAVTHACPSNVYKQATGSDVEPILHPVLTPRNTKQVQNAAYQVTQSTHLSRDSVYNLLELAYDADTFVHKISLFPNLAVTCGNPEIIQHCNTSLLLSPFEHSSLLSYDTTFCLGDFYASVLLFRMSIFDQSPVIPVLFFIHDSKTTTTHKEFFDTASRLLPNLKHSQTPLVTDQEDDIVRAVSEVLPSVKHIFGWNHLLQDIKRYCKSNECNIPTVCDTVRKLLLSTSQHDYTEALQQQISQWPDKFKDYYLKSVDEIVKTKLGRWIVEQYGAFDPYSGVTTNQSEGFNTVMKVTIHTYSALCFA